MYRSKLLQLTFTKKIKNYTTNKKIKDLMWLSFYWKVEIITFLMLRNLFLFS